jgi:hypothetical protein
MTEEPIVGGCQCESLRYVLRARPLFTHACHCLICRRRSGTAFALSTIVLRDDFTLTSGDVKPKQISPRSTVYRCAICETTIYTASTRFPVTYKVPGGTFDDPAFVEPGAHIWVKRKHPWIIVPAGIPQFDEDYDIRTTWPREALERLDAANAAHSPG